ncbi:MAG: cation transporter [Chitinophagales bacterium]|nr:cation transporter [Chitinophagales bacterium]
MRNLKIVAPLFLLLLLPSLIMADDAKKKTEIIYIQTSAVCGECKERIESAVKDLKGIKQAELNLTDKKLMVEYAVGKTTPETIKQAVAKSGYDADEVKADPSAYQSLPMCCKKDEGKH